MWHTFMADGGGNGSSSSSSLGFGEIDDGGSLRPQLGLASVYLSQLGVKGCLLTGKLIMVSSCPQLNIDLLSMGSHLLFLLVSLLMIGEQLHSWLGYRGSHRDRRYGLESQSILRRWHSGDGEELHS
jgi:hypothetical protein